MRCGATMFFQRLEDLRIDADKTQEEIAKVLNCRREVYRRYEKGIFEIPVWALIRLADYFGVTTDYLLGYTNADGSKNPDIVNSFNNNRNNKV